MVLDIYILLCPSLAQVASKHVFYFVPNECLGLKT